MNTKESAAVVFVIGAVAGGVTAMLLAPQSGAQLRRRIKDGADELKTAARVNAGAVTGAVKGAVSQAKHTYHDELDKRRNAEFDPVARRTGG